MRSKALDNLIIGSLGLVIVGLTGFSMGNVKENPPIVTPHRQMEQSKPNYNINDIRGQMGLIITNIRHLNQEMPNPNKLTLNTQYDVNKAISNKLIMIMKSIPDNDPIKTDLVKILDSVDKMNYALSITPYNSSLLTNEIDNVLQSMMSFNQKYK